MKTSAKYFGLAVGPRQGCQTSLSAKDFPWICGQNRICPWFLKNVLLSLNIVQRPWKFLN